MYILVFIMDKKKKYFGKVILASLALSLRFLKS